MAKSEVLTDQAGTAAWAPAEHRRPGLILAILALSNFVAILDLWITNVGIPAIGRGVHSSSLSDLSWVLNGYAIVYAALLVPAGRLTDRYGRKGGFLLGLALFAAASLGAGLSSDVWVLVTFRVVQALGAAIFTPASLGLVLTTAPEGKAARNVKIWFTAGALSASGGPILGGLLIQASWRWLFLVNVPVVVLAIVSAIALVPNVRHEQNVGIPDLLGGVLVIAGIGSLALATVKGYDWGWGSGRVIGGFVVSAVAIVAFLYRSARHRAPVVDLSLFRDRIFSAANATAALTFVNFGIILLLGMLYLQYHWHYSAIRAGFATAPSPIAFAIFATVGETLQQKVGMQANRIAAFGGLVIAVGLAIMATRLSIHPSYASAFLPGWFVVGAGLGLSVPMTMTGATADLRPEQAATGSAIVTMSQQVGAVIGISILVAVLGAASGAAVLHHYHTALWVNFGVALAGAVTAIGIGPVRTAASSKALAAED